MGQLLWLKNSSVRFLKCIHKLAPTLQWSSILSAAWRSFFTSCTRMYADVIHLCSLQTIAIVMIKLSACVCVCVGEGGGDSRYCTAIKYLEKPVLRKASCWVAPFNCTSGHLWILDAGLSLPWGCCKVPLFAGMTDNWITCMCQMFLINTSEPAGMGDWVLSRNHLLTRMS